MNLSYDKVTRVIAKALAITPETLRGSFAPATFDELPQIIQFRHDFLPATKKWNDENYLCWRYDFSPFESLDENTSNRLWRVKINNQLLGIIGLDVAEFYYQDEIKKLHNPLDLLVNPSVDGLGLGVWMSLVLENEYPFLFAMGATRHSESIVKKLFHPMPDLGAWKLLINTRDFIAKKIHNRFLQPPASQLLNLYQRCVIAFKLLGKTANCELQQIHDFLPLQTDLQQINKRYQLLDVLFRNRTAEFLNWRFLHNPRRQYTALGAFSKHQLKSFVVYHIEKNHLNIDDLWATANDESYVLSLLSGLIHLARKKNLHLISFIAHSHLWKSAMQTANFRWRDDGHIFSVYIKDDAFNKFKQVESWLLTSADTHSEGF
jgi:hypothetical protein